MSDSDFTRFEKAIFVNKPLEAVYRSWATTKGLTDWFLKDAHFSLPTGEGRPPRIYTMQGDHYSWTWMNGVNEVGEVLEADPQSGLSFTFGAHTVVKVSLELDAGWTHVVVSQTMDHPSVDDRRKTYLDCSEGWTFFLANLKSVMECGYDLREKHRTQFKVINI